MDSECRHQTIKPLNVCSSPGNSILLLASAVSTLGGLVFGYELGIISGALLQLRAEFALSCVQQEVLVSSLLVGALLASVVGGFLIDRHGRRKCILLSNVLIFLGSLVLLISSYVALLAGRILVGFAMCISSMSCCIFVSEVVTPDRRGFLVSLYETGITVGILAAYTANYILSEHARGWKWMFGLAIIPTLIQLLSIWFIPPRAEGRVSQRECVQSEADFMRGIENPEAGTSDAAVERKNFSVEYDTMYLLQRRDNMRTRTLLGVGLVLFQQFTGQPNVLFYASTIFHSVGFHSDSSAVLASLGLGLVKVASTLTSMVFSDRVGRRPLLISGCAAMALCMITMGLLSGQSVMDTKRPCEAVDIRSNGTFLPHIGANNQSGLGATFQRKRLANIVTPGRDVVLDSTLPVQIHEGATNWIILVCMMVVVSAYSIGFGPSLYLLLVIIIIMFLNVKFYNRLL